MKRCLLIALALLIAVQWAVPLTMIAGKYAVLKNGVEVKFQVQPVDPYDAFRGRYVAINPQQDAEGTGRYGLLEVDADGFARIVKVTEEKPREGLYITSGERDFFSLPIDRYYMDEKLAPQAEMATRNAEGEGTAYVTVRVQKGKAVVSGLFVEGIPIEEYVQRENTSLFMGF